MRPVLEDWTLSLKNIFLPCHCKLCDARLLTEDNGFFCPTCWERSPRIERPFCVACGRPHRGAIGFGTQSNFPCDKCRDLAQKRPPICRVYGAAYYEGAIEEAIKLFKFRDKPRLAAPLAEVMAEFAAAEMDCGGYDLIVPVPLYRVRHRERGFNQSWLLAEALAGRFANAECGEELVRTRPTLVQSRLKDERQRLENVKGAFAPKDAHRIPGKRVLLIDDVVTSGGTVTECAKTLLGAGARAVDILATALAVATGPKSASF